MLKAAYRAAGDLVSPEFRSVLLKALGLTFVLFIAVLIIVEVMLITLTGFSWPWADWVLAAGTGMVLLVAFFFLASPVTAAFAGLFLDGVAELVETKHYPRDPRGVALSTSKAISVAFRFFIVVLFVNLAVLPLIWFGVGAAALVAANAYLLGREYFQMVAMRHMPAEEARQLRQMNSPAIFLAGLLPAFLSLLPIVNFMVPLFATSYFTHFFKSVRASSA
jgi:CysZ protein